MKSAWIARRTWLVLDCAPNLNPLTFAAEGSDRRCELRAGRVALLLALITAALSIACGGGDGDGANVNTSPSAGSPANGDSDGLVELQMTAGNTRFDKSRLFAPAGSEVSLTLDNRDSVEHTFSLYVSEGSTDPLFPGSRFSGPAFLVYQFTAPEDPGTYHFQCDVHPDVMKGQFIVESVPAGT